VTPLLVLTLALVASVWALRSDTRTAFVLAVAIVTNASGVLELVHGTTGFLRPLAAAAVIAGLFRKDRGAPVGTLRSGAFVGPALVAAVFVVAAVGPFVAAVPTESSAAVTRLFDGMLLLTAVALNARRPAAIASALLGAVVGGVIMATITNMQSLTNTREQSFGGFGSWSVHLLADVGSVDRAGGPFNGDPNSYSQYLVVSLGAAVGLAVVASRTHRMALVVAAGWIGVALLQTRSRSGILAVLMTALVCLFATQSARRIASVLLGSALVLAFTPLASASRLGTLLAATDAETADSSVAGRTSEAQAAVGMFVDHPLTGVGFGAYQSEYLHYARRIGLDTRFEARSAHSLPLEIAAEQGVLGLAVWVAMLVFCIVTVRQLRTREPGVGLALALSGGAFIASSLFLHDVHPNVMWALIGLTVGAATWLHRDPAPAAPEALIAPVPPAVWSPPDPGRVRVAMIIQNYVPALGGAERQLASVAPLLLQAGIEPIVVTRAMPGRPTNDWVDGVRVIRIPTPGPKTLRSLSFVWGARRALRSVRPNVIHAFDTLTPTLIALGHRRRYGTPVAIKLLRSGYLGDLQRLVRKPGGRRRLKKLLSETDRFVVISNEIDTELADLGVASERRCWVPNGVDVKKFRPASGRRPRFRIGGPVVIATGRLAPEKRLVELAARWDRVRLAAPGAKLRIVGEGPERPALAGYEGVEVVGLRDDVNLLLRAADVYVSASEAEGLSNSLLEAMAARLPCVVTDVGGVAELFADTGCGIAVPVDELDQLVDEVIGLLANPNLRFDMGHSARARVVAGWSLTATGDRLARLYRELASERTPASHHERQEVPVG
jgi:glycosyltransferase involved in cell wall biosynthesis/O-antigen ligase